MNFFFERAVKKLFKIFQIVRASQVTPLSLSSRATAEARAATTCIRTTSRSPSPSRPPICCRSRARHPRTASAAPRPSPPPRRPRRRWGRAMPHSRKSEFIRFFRIMTSSALILFLGHHFIVCFLLLQSSERSHQCWEADWRDYAVLSAPLTYS